MKEFINKIKEFFSDLSLCDFGLHEVTHTHITGVGYEVGYCNKCGKSILF